MEAQDILTFWFEELTTEQWWVKDPTLDKSIENRFGAVHQQAIKGELYHWRNTARGRLAEVIVLDQFSRNIYRDNALAFAFDSQALVLAQEAIAQGCDKALTPSERSFLYLPFMHSESLVIHDIAVGLYEQNGIESNLDFELQHRQIIERFGRYPHRNRLLNRISTSEELAFLKQPNSSF